MPKLLLAKIADNFDDSDTDFEQMMGPFYPVDRQTDDLLKETEAYTLEKVHRSKR